MKTSALLCGFLMACGLVLGVLTGCHGLKSYPDASSYPTDVYLVNLPVDVVNAELSQMCRDMHLIISQEHTSGIDGLIKVSSASSAAIITTVADGLSRTKITVAPDSLMLFDERGGVVQVEKQSMTNLQKGMGLKIQKAFADRLLSK